MSNFDQDTSGTLSEEEIDKTCSYMTSMYPNFDVAAFKAKISKLKLSPSSSIKIKDVTELLADVVNSN